MVLSVRNVEHQDSMGFGQPSYHIVWSSLVEERLSKALGMSRKRVEVVTYLAFPMSISYVLWPIPSCQNMHLDQLLDITA
jgi:hypothetical protein